MTTRRLVMCAVMAAGCANDVRPADPVDIGGTDIPADYTRMIGGTWTLPPGANVYRCVRVTVPQDSYITSFKAIAPQGTHHAVLALVDETIAGPDGERDCDAGALGKIMLYASSVGTPPFEFPADVGIRVRAGQQVHLNLHLFNPGDEPLAGETAIFVKTQDVAPQTLAELVLAGPLDITIPSNGQPTAVTGECTATAPYTLFALWPHMHTFATNQKVEHVRGADTSIVHDEPFRFDEQRYHALDPMMQVAAGDRIRVTCTYSNSSGTVVTYGDGRFNEMCFAGLYRFPASDSFEYCGE